MLGRDITFYNPQNLYLGDDVYISKSVWINSFKKISISNDVLIAPNVEIASSKHTYMHNSFRKGKPDGNPIKISSGSWIGANSVITAGSKIGSGCLISACSVVIGEIKDNYIAGGNPAKLIKPLK